MDFFLSIPFLVFLPMLMSFFIMSPLFTNNEVAVRRFAKAVCGFHFAYAIFMLLFFDYANPYTSKLSLFGFDWIQALGVTFSFKLDGIGMILVLLTSFIFLMASMASKFCIRKNHKFYYSMLLLSFKPSP